MDKKPMINIQAGKGGISHDGAAGGDGGNITADTSIMVVLGSYMIAAELAGASLTLKEQPPAEKLAELSVKLAQAVKHELWGVVERQKPGEEEYEPIDKKPLDSDS